MVEKLYSITFVIQKQTKMDQSNIKNYYKELCKELKIKELPILFKSVARGGACIEHDGKGRIFGISIDMKRCKDIERAILHETAHQILITKNNNCTHNATFRKLENKLIDNYFYSNFSVLLYA